MPTSKKQPLAKKKAKSIQLGSGSSGAGGNKTLPTGMGLTQPNYFVFDSTDSDDVMHLPLGGRLLTWRSTPKGVILDDNIKATPALKALTPDMVRAVEADGGRIVVRKQLSGRLGYSIVRQLQTADPHFLLVESHQLSSYLGDYGAGRTIKTFTLLPGEQTTITVKSFTRSESTYNESSSVLDSFTDEGSEEFESAVTNEQSDREATEKASEYYADVEAKANWGVASGSAAGGVSGSTNASREELAKTVSSATTRHASAASARRDIQIDTSNQVTETTERERLVTRELKNINVGRTLNFVFRQMNQSFASILHLVDVKVAFFNGFNESKREVPLSELDSLIAEFVVDDVVTRGLVKDRILGQLRQVRDHRGDAVDLVQEPGDGSETEYLRVNSEMVTRYQNEEQGIDVNVPGIVMGVNYNVMRTEGVIVEALLGQGNALDDYSVGLQVETVRERRLQNDLLAEQVKRNEEALEVVRSGDAEKAQRFAQVFGEGERDGSGGVEEGE